MAEYVLTKDNFEAEVLQADKPFLIDFWATWCGPCRMLAPIVEEIAEEYEGTLKVGKINVDAEPELAEAFRVSSIPMLVLVKDGKIANTMVGYRPKAEIVAMLPEKM
ncbi:MAG: thioredoxin [Clostridia bacterium]|nr:thioredoxin [Clostridia bacterium]